MKPFINVKFTSGHVYEVPTEAVAADYASHLLKTLPEQYPTLDDALKEARENFADDHEVKEWALNNMNWEDLAPHARAIRFEPAAKDWGEADLFMSTEPAKIPSLNGSTSLLDMTVEMALASICQSKDVCHVSLIGDGGRPALALAVIQGGETVVNFYVGGLQSLTDALSAAAAQAAKTNPKAPITPAAIH